MSDAIERAAAVAGDWMREKQRADATCAYAVELREALERVAPYFYGEHAYDHPCCVAIRAALAKNPESPNPTGDTPYRDDAESGKQTGSGVKGPASPLTAGNGECPICGCVPVPICACPQ